MQRKFVGQNRSAEGNKMSKKTYHLVAVVIVHLKVLKILQYYKSKTKTIITYAV